MAHKTTTAAEIKQQTENLLAPDGFFALAEVEVKGRKVKQYANAEKSLVNLLQAGRAHGDKPCMVYQEQRWSFNEFYAHADAVNYVLREQLGVKQGERIAIAMRNYPEWGAAFFGCVFAGALVVPLNSWGKADELLFGIKDSGCSVLICDQQRFNLIADKVDELGIQVIVAKATDDLSAYSKVSAYDDIVGSALGKSADFAEVDPDDDAMMLYTSGSTGTPKGVPSTHRAACQAIMNYWFSGALVAGLDNTGEEPDPDQPEQMANLLCVPLFHGTGLFAGLLVAICMGFKTVMMYKWDPVKALELVEQEKITQTNAVPALVQALLSSDQFDNFDTSTLSRVGTGGAASPSTLPELVRKRLRKPNCGTGWGMTETCVLGVSMGGSTYDLKPKAAGIRSPIIDIRITGENGEVLPNGEEGEIEVRGVTVFHGYWHNDEATKKTFNGEWLQTGDVGYLDDDDYLFITGRSKDLVIRGGENIFPGEIEDACYAIDGVMEVAVYGVPDEALGEELAMNIALRPGLELTPDDIREHLSGAIAGFKVPRYISVGHDLLPKNVSNKIDKLFLRKHWKPE